MFCTQRDTEAEIFACGSCAINNFVFGLNIRSSDSKADKVYWRLEYLQELFLKLLNKHNNNNNNNNNPLPGEQYFQSLVTRFKSIRNKKVTLDTYLRRGTISKEGMTSPTFITSVFNDEQKDIQLSRVCIGGNKTVIELKINDKFIRYPVNVIPPTSFNDIIRWSNELETSVGKFLFTDRILLGSSSLLYKGAGHKVALRLEGNEWYLYDSELKKPQQVTNIVNMEMIGRGNQKIKMSNTDLFDITSLKRNGLVEMLIIVKELPSDIIYQTEDDIVIDMTLLKF